MLGHDVVLNIACVQVARDEFNLISALLKVLHALLKKLVVIGFKADFRVFFEEGLVHFELPREGQPALFVPCARPRIAEVYEQPFDLVVGCNNLIELLDVVVDEQKVRNIVPGFAVFLKQLNNRAPADAEHINLDVDGDYVFIGVIKRELSCKTALAAADFKVQRLFFRESLSPFACVLVRIFNEKIANAQLGLSPFLFSYSHIASFK